MSIVAETVQCPECGEKDYIQNPSTGKYVCLSCGYQNQTSKMSKDFGTPKNEAS